MAERKGRGRKISIVHIAQILLSESDAEHPLSQQQILAFLRERYGMEMDRKAVRRNLEALRDGGLPVVCREVERVIEGKPAPLSLDWYWDRDLTKEDMKALIDLLYFSHLPAAEVRQLAQKLKNLYMRPFDDGKAAVKNIPALNQLEPPDETLAVLAEAIENKKMIQFFYDHYEADGKRYHGKDIGGVDRVYRVSPYVVAASDDGTSFWEILTERMRLHRLRWNFLTAFPCLRKRRVRRRQFPARKWGSAYQIFFLS